MKTEFTSNRRGFIKSAAVVGGLSILMGLTGRARAETGKKPSEPEEKDQGYRLTEHVKKYYETAGL
jgi:hypothetical protein